MAIISEFTVISFLSTDNTFIIDTKKETKMQVNQKDMVKFFNFVLVQTFLHIEVQLNFDGSNSDNSNTMISRTLFVVPLFKFKRSSTSTAQTSLLT